MHTPSILCTRLHSTWPLNVPLTYPQIYNQVYTDEVTITNTGKVSLDYCAMGVTDAIDLHLGQVSVTPTMVSIMINNHCAVHNTCFICRAKYLHLKVRHSLLDSFREFLEHSKKISRYYDRYCMVQVIHFHLCLGTSSSL